MLIFVVDYDLILILLTEQVIMFLMNIEDNQLPEASKDYDDSLVTDG